MNTEETGNWKCTHKKDLERFDFDFENGFKVIHDYKHHRVYTERNGEATMEPEPDTMTVQEFHDKLIGIEKL